MDGFISFSTEFFLLNIFLLLSLGAERHTSKLAGFLIVLVLGAGVGAVIAAYIFYKYRLRVCPLYLANYFSFYHFNYPFFSF